MNDRTHYIVAIVLLLFSTTLAAQRPSDHPYASRMWYAKPAINWNEALPIGNGRLGGMIDGGVRTEHISLNEQTLWSGSMREWNNPHAKEYLPLVRAAALRGDYRKADSLSHFMQGPYTESYMPMGDLFIEYTGINDSLGYSRELDLDRAVTNTQFTSGGNSYLRTAFSSFPDQVMVLRTSCSKQQQISFRLRISSKLHYTVRAISPNHLVLRGKCPVHVEPAYRWRLKDDKAIQYAPGDKGEGMNFEIHVIVRSEDGTLKATDNSIQLENANAATIIVSAATSYNGFRKSPGLEGKDPSIQARRHSTVAITKSYSELLKRHLADYQPIFRRVQYDLGASKYADLPTDERLRRMKTYVDPEMVAMIAQYGRYILIAGSRPGGQPVNLKGIWNDRLRPEYSSNWCVDHDAQMFYYAVETANLSEFHQPFLQFIADVAENGRKTAAINYGMRGWCAHHNVDIWRSSGPVGDWGEGSPNWATWNMSGPWLSNHLFEHYQFTGDLSFLRKKAWPVMKGAAEFLLDWLIDDGKGGLISVPSVSPENTFIMNNGDTANISVNTTADIALAKELFTNCLLTTDLLGIDKEFASRLRTALSKLAPYRVGSKGQLLEWSEEWKSLDPSHRHLSHMYPVFPGSEISPMGTPQLSDAAKKALTLREKTNCSWGFAWKAACWARLGEADSAWQTWQYQLQYVDPKSTSSIDNYGLFPNLFNSDGRDVIMNGNGCATAVLTEMILQSHLGVVDLLPALPTVFNHGSVKGLRARGGFEVQLSWKENKLRTAMIESKLGRECKLRAGSAVRIYDGANEVPAADIGGNVFVFKTKKGKRYKVLVIE